jgi:hypothetical protein
MKQTPLSMEQLFLYMSWFNALMAAENPPTDASPEDLMKLISKLDKAKSIALDAGVPGVK